MAATIQLNEIGRPAGLAAGLASSYWEPRWYAAYTVARHERCVERQLAERKLDCFLPSYKSIHRWKDRRKEVEAVLFPCYVFVHIPLKDRMEVLRLPSVVHLVSCRGNPVEIPGVDIDGVRELVARASVEPYPYLSVGQRVRIRTGPLSGLEGFLVRKKDRFRLVLSVDLIMRSVSVEVNAEDVEAIGGSAQFPALEHS